MCSPSDVQIWEFIFSGRKKSKFRENWEFMGIYEQNWEFTGISLFHYSQLKFRNVRIKFEKKMGPTIVANSHNEWLLFFICICEE